jgi:hypothetical protein
MARSRHSCNEHPSIITTWQLNFVHRAEVVIEFRTQSPSILNSSQKDGYPEAGSLIAPLAAEEE